MALAAVALGLVLATGAGAAQITADNVNEHIAAAKTAADHEAIASGITERLDATFASASTEITQHAPGEGSSADGHALTPLGLPVPPKVPTRPTATTCSG